MRSFRFRLEPLRRIRAFELRRIAAALEAARIAYAAHCESAASVDRALERHNEQTALRLREGLTAGALLERARAEEALRAEGTNLVAQRGILREAVEVAVEDVRAAHGRVEALDRLRKRKAVRWQRESERRTQRELDEQALRNRRRGERP